MKKNGKVTLFLIAVPLVSAALVVRIRYAEARWFPRASRLRCPRILDLGEWESGTTAVGHFRVRNDGNSMLTADHFSTTCSCAGVEREIDGHLSRVKSVDLAPGEEIELTVRMGVGVRPGESQSVLVGFQTNDPTQPAWEMAVVVPRVSGGYFAEPAAVVFGSIPLGGKMSRVLDLYDNHTAGRRVETVRAVPPDRFSVSPSLLTDQDRHTVHPTAGKLLARFLVTPRTERAGRFDGEIEVSLANEAHRIPPIPVLGEVVSDVECRPTTLVLPRQTEGHSVSFGEVFIGSRHEKPIEVLLESLSPSVGAEVRVVPGHPDQRLLRIEWKAEVAPRQQLVFEAGVRAVVRSEGTETKMDIPVHFGGGQP